MMQEVARSTPPWLDVSRETIARLARMLDEVLRWNAAINLISTATIEQSWARHVLDSAQLAGFVAGRPGIWADLGSGGGFPGMVLAIIAAETAPDLRFVLVESNRRKAAFLQQTARLLAVDVRILPERAERLEPLMVDVVSARAVTSLMTLLPYAHRHLKSGGVAVFMKGASHQKEIIAARRDWSFDGEVQPSRSDPSAGILVIRNIVHV